MKKQMDNLIFKPILVSGIESANNKITLLEQETGKQYPVKYSFFQTTQAGEPSKAYTQFLELGVSIGKVYEIAVKETQGINKMSGKPVVYRNIAYFKDRSQPESSQTQQDASRASYTPNQAQTPTQPKNSISRSEFNEVKREINDLKWAVHALWVVGVEGDEEKMKAYELAKIPVVQKEEINIEEINF